jgi:hypothetical protein
MLQGIGWSSNHSSPESHAAVNVQRGVVPYLSIVSHSKHIPAATLVDCSYSMNRVWHPLEVNNCDNTMRSLKTCLL